MFKVLDGSAQNLSKYFLQSSSRFYHSGVCIKASTMCWKGEFSSDPPVDSWEQAVPASQFSQLVVNTPNCWSTHGSFLNRPSENTEMLTTGVDAAPPTSYEGPSSYYGIYAGEIYHGIIWTWKVQEEAVEEEFKVCRCLQFQLAFTSLILVLATHNQTLLSFKQREFDTGEEERLVEVTLQFRLFSGETNTRINQWPFWFYRAIVP